MLDYHVLRNWDFGDIVQRYSARDTMLYALGVGMGSDPLDEQELGFVFERELRALPTMATVLGSPGFWWPDPRTGVNWSKLVHGEQALRLFKPLAAAGTIVSRARVASVTDKGLEKGALVLVVRELRDHASGELMAEERNVAVLRGDGGYSVRGAPSDAGPESLPPVPERPPDLQIRLPTLPQQALLYRLSGDLNPLHVDPAAARAAGFPRPVLHGLCTYGMAAHALLRTISGYDAARIRSLAARFTAPLYAGESVDFQIWRSSSNTVQLRARVAARNSIILDRGLAEIV